MSRKKKSNKGYDYVDCLYCALLFNANAKPIKTNNKGTTLYRRSEYEYTYGRR